MGNYTAMSKNGMSGSHIMNFAICTVNLLFTFPFPFVVMWTLDCASLTSFGTSTIFIQMLHLIVDLCYVTVNPFPVNCTLGDVRLTNGSSHLEGRVEVCFGNLWGTICHNSWDNRDAGVICKQLFNSSFGRLLLAVNNVFFLFWRAILLPHLGGHAINGSKFGVGYTSIVIESINCNGTEASLTDCSTITSVSNAISTCNGSDVAGIVCYGMS